MTITALESALKTQAGSGQIRLDTSLLDATLVVKLQQDFGLKNSEYLSISGVTAADVPNPVGNQITLVKGGIAVFKLTIQHYQLLFSVVSDKVEICLQLKPDDAWTFKSSFPDLTLFPFDILAPSKVLFIFSSTDQPKYQPSLNTYPKTVDLKRGLNFVSLLAVDAIQVIKLLLGSDTPTSSQMIFGTFSADLRFPYPVTELNLNLLDSPIDIIKGISFQQLSMRVEITDPGDGYIQDFLFGIASQTEKLDYFIALNSSLDRVNFSVQPKAGEEFTLETLSESDLVTSILPTGTNFANFVPETIKSVFQTIAFYGASFAFSIKDKKVSSVYFAIGQAKDKTIAVGPFSFDNLFLTTQWNNPGDASSSVFINFSAQARIGIDIFKDPFYFNMSVSKNGDQWNLDLIEATYNGAISIGDIIEDIAPGTNVPDVLKSLYFGKFFVSASPSSSTFTISCTGGFMVEVADQSLSSVFNLMVSKSAAGFDFLLTGGFAIGNDYWFNLTAEISKNAQNTVFIFTAEANEVPLSELASKLFSEYDIEGFEFPVMDFKNVSFKYNTPTVGQLEISADYEIASSDGENPIFDQTGTIIIKRVSKT